MEQTKIEKKAEEYIMREDVVTENDRVPVDNGYGWQTVSFEDEVKRAYIDGLAEGEPKWHDLRKNPNDLPKEIEICSNPVYVISPHDYSDLAQYDYKRKLWCYKHSNEHILYEVIAWCELPKFCGNVNDYRL